MIPWRPRGTTRSVDRPKMDRWCQNSGGSTIDEISKKEHSMEKPRRGPYTKMDGYWLQKKKNFLKYSVIIPIVKNKMAEWTAIGVYSILAVSICFSVISATACLAVISFDNTLDELKIWIAVSSSNILPSDVLRTSKILSSISLSWLKMKEFQRFHII